jgi:hypothetical protein
MVKIKIGERRKGALMHDEAWWHLVIEDNGSHYVEHEWSYVDPYGKGKGNSGTENIPTKDFLAGDHNDGLKNELRAQLKKHGIE